MRKSKRIPFANKPKFAALVDGDCEFWYLQMLKRNEPTIKVDLKPEIPQRKKLSEQFERVIELSRHYDKVFWIVDYDVINAETKLAKKGTATAAQAFKKYILQFENNYINVVVIINNPCLEFWILLHFVATGKYFTNCEEATSQLKKYLAGYEKTSKYFTKQDNDIYLRLKPKLKTAIANATKLKPFDFDNPHTAIAQMQYLFGAKELKTILESI